MSIPSNKFYELLNKGGVHLGWWLDASFYGTLLIVIVDAQPTRPFCLFYWLHLWVNSTTSFEENALPARKTDCVTISSNQTEFTNNFLNVSFEENK